MRFILRLLLKLRHPFMICLRHGVRDYCDGIWECYPCATQLRRRNEERGVMLIKAARDLWK